MSYRTNSYELDMSKAELTISLSNGMSIQIPPNSQIAGYYAIKIRGDSGCVLCFQNRLGEGLGIIENIPYDLVGELEQRLTELQFC